MTYSNYGSDNNSQTSESQNIVTEITQIVDDVNEEYVIAEMAVDMDDIKENLDCLIPYIIQLIKPSVEGYDYNLVNYDGTQFEDCPNVNYAYRNGWQYIDFDPDPDFQGQLTQSVLTFRAVPCGPPVTSMGGEEFNPGRLQRLPNQTTSYETLEPKRFLWIHPWLEMGQSDQDLISDTLGEETPFSLFHSYKNWQSGPVQNGPANEEVVYRAGFETMPGGESNFGNNQPTSVLWQGSADDNRFVYSIGSSRGKEDLAGYNDEKTEGLEYGACGVHGWLRSVFNDGVKTKSNSGLKFLYMMGRFSTSVDELKYNIMAFLDFMESIQQGFGASYPEMDYALPEEANDIVNWKNGRTGLGISDADKPKLLRLIKWFQKAKKDV